DALFVVLLFFPSLSPCGRGWIDREAVETGEGCRALGTSRLPLIRLRFAKPPSPTRGEGRKKKGAAVSSDAF
ncbi:hypothetical protein, partial [Tardiphaga sp.]|uniref:hypothetical protein n=1 Tax=Tardiphaga sp. TaxID=1926292 RepID=UPI0025F0910A